MESYQEKARTLSERFGITYEEAMKALEECDGDILDAVIRLEAQGTINRTSANFSTSYEQRSAEKSNPQLNEEKHSSGGADSYFDKAVRFFLRTIDSSLCISRGEREIAAIPAILFIILLVAAFKIVVAAIIIGLFVGCKYSLRSPDDKAPSDGASRPEI